MNRARVFKWLRITASAACLIVCGLLVGLWVRSYYTADEIHGRTSHTRALNIYSMGGLIGFGTYTKSDTRVNYRWRISTGNDAAHNLPDNWHDVFRKFEGSTFPGGLRVGLPLWFLVLLSGTLAATPWIRWRFSLRTMFITTAIIAALLGLAVWWARWPR